MQRLVVAVLLAVTLLLACCGPLPSGPSTAPTVPAFTPALTTATPGVPSPFSGLESGWDTDWLLTSLNGRRVVEGPAITLFFPGSGHLDGETGCGPYGVEYTIVDNQIHVLSIFRPSCAGAPDSARQQQEAYFEALEGVASMWASHDRLECYNAQGETILVFARKVPPTLDPALAGTAWILQLLHGQRPLAGSLVSLRLGPEGIAGFRRRNLLGGFGGCNQYAGEYEAADKGILLVGKLWPWQPEQDCPSPEGVTEQQEMYFEALRRAAGYRLSGDRLQVRDASGETILVYGREAAFEGDPAELVGTVWQLVSMQGRDLVEGSSIILSFHGQSRASGHTGCQDYTAVYEARGGDLTFLSMTRLTAACLDQSQGSQSTAYLSQLLLTAHYRLSKRQLELVSIWGERLVYEPLPEEARLDLEGHTWSLVTFLDPNPDATPPSVYPLPTNILAGSLITLTLEAGTASGSAGCNTYSAAVRRAGTSLSVEAVTATERACQPRRVEQERRYLDTLARVVAYCVYGTRLWLETDDGRALLFICEGCD